jgi:sugar-specific transcriptional regulator TrmB
MLIQHYSTLLLPWENCLSLKENDTVVLSKLGLTKSQANVYLTLLKLGQATGKTLSQNAKVARQEIYRILGELQEKGCVEKLIALPTEFKPVPIQECLLMLVKQKKQELLETENLALQLVEDFKNKMGPIPDKESFIILVPEKEAYLRKFRNSIDSSKISCDMILHWECLMFGLREAHDLWQQAMHRGVKIRFVVFNATKEKDNDGIINKFKKKGQFEVRFAFYPPPATMTIWDGKEASISLLPKPNPHHTSSLWSNNSGLIAVFHDYFETVWRDSYRDKNILTGKTMSRTIAQKAI